MARAKAPGLEMTLDDEINLDTAQDWESHHREARYTEIWRTAMVSWNMQKNTV
jgi:hypothetical protein